MRFSGSAFCLLSLLVPSLAVPSELYEQDFEVMAREEPYGHKTDLYIRDAEALLASLDALARHPAIQRREAIAPDGAGSLVTSVANFISVMTNGCPRPGQPDYQECKRCKAKKGKRDLFEREAKGGGGKGGGKKGGGKGGGGGGNDDCAGWKF